MEERNAQFPLPPFYWKNMPEAPPEPIKTDFSMFGVITNVDQFPKRVESQDLKVIHNEADSYAIQLKSLQYSLLNTALEILKALVHSPNGVQTLLADYEQLILNFYHTTHLMRPS
jgi:hypothetical protein